MSTPSLGLPVSAPLSRLKNKRVLLLDTSATMRDRRAESMRKLGMEVDCAADVSEARSWWRADLYSLVLIDMESGLGHRDKFCDDMRRASPPQQISFLVGKPGYLADIPKADGVPLAVKSSGDQSVRDDVRAALAVVLPGASQRWGILEASRRISAVRSLSHARSRATQERPMPPRDLETRESKRAAAESKNLESSASERGTLNGTLSGSPETRPLETRTLDDLLREELQ
jgi:CheY-like chemotaxis protein